MHKFTLAALVGIAALLATAGAQAEDATNTGTKNKVAATSSFAALDRNGDHRISRSEAGFDRVLSETFAELDTDGDGFVSAAEFAAARKGPTAANLEPR